MAKRKRNQLLSMAVVAGIVAALVLSVPVGAYLQAYVFGPLISQDMGGGMGGGSYTPPPSGGTYQPPPSGGDTGGGSYQPPPSGGTGGYQPMGNQPTGGSYQTPMGDQSGGYHPAGWVDPNAGGQYQPPSGGTSGMGMGGQYQQPSGGYQAPLGGQQPSGQQPGQQSIPQYNVPVPANTPVLCNSQGGKWLTDKMGNGTCDFSGQQPAYQQPAAEKMDPAKCGQQKGNWKSDNQGGGWCEFGQPPTKTTQPQYGKPMGPESTTTQPQYGKPMGPETTQPYGPEMEGQMGPEMMGPEGPMTDEERQKFEDQRQQGEVAREVKNIQREAKNFTRDLSRMKKDIERMTKKAKGLNCPAATSALELISNAEKTITELESATASTWEDIEALRTKLENLRGGPNADVDEPLMQQFGNIMPRIGACEGLSQFVKEITRFRKEVEKDLARETKKGGMDEESLAGMKEILAKLQALEKNPTAGLTEEDMQDGDFIRYLFEDTLQPLREEMDNIRRSAGDMMSKKGVCQALQNAKKEVERQANFGEMSEEASSLLKEASSLVTEGMSACDKKDYDTAQKIMFELENLKQKADQLGFGDKGFNEKMEFGPQARDLLQGSIDDEELLKRLEEKLLSKMENQIKLITEAVQRQLADTLSKIVESKFIEITGALTKSLDNITYLSENAKNIALSNRQQVTNVLGEIEGKKVSNRVQNELKAVTEDALKENWSTSAMAEIKNKLSDVASVASSESDALAAIKDLKQTIDEQKTGDIDNQVKAGLRPFKDTAPDAWFFGSATTLKDAGILKGTAEGMMDAGRNVALAEAAAMMARGVGINEDASAGYRAAGVPEWAKGVAGGLAQMGVDMANDPNVNFSKDATRGQMAHVIVETLEKQGKIDPSQFQCNLKFTDVKCGQKYSEDISVLNQLGIAKGNPDGSFGMSSALNRAEASAMVQRTMDAVEAK